MNEHKNVPRKLEVDTNSHSDRPITALRTVLKQVHQHSTSETNHGGEQAEGWNGRHKSASPEPYIVTLIPSLLLSASVHSFVKLGDWTK